MKGPDQNERIFKYSTRQQVVRKNAIAKQGYLQSMVEATKRPELLDELLEIRLVDLSAFFDPLVQHANNRGSRITCPINPSEEGILGTWRR